MGKGGGMKFFVSGPLPGFNEIIAASSQEIKWLHKGNRRIYNYTILKKTWTDRVVMAFLKEHGRPESPVKKPIHIYCEWIEPNNRRDPDNVFCGGKFLLDGLEKVGFIKRDSRKWIAGIRHDFGENDAKNPGVVVRIFT